MKQRTYYFLALGLVLAFLAIDYHFSKRAIELKSTRTGKLVDLTKGPQFNRGPTQAENEKAAEDQLDLEIPMEQFKKEFKFESEQVGQIQSDPELAENRIQSLARQIDSPHIRYLEKVMIDQNANGDERAMALEFLSRNQSPEALAILKDFAKTEGASAGHRQEFELALKAQAIEGIGSALDQSAALTYLDEIKKQSGYSFIKDRAARVEYSIRNNSTSVEEQDNEALKKIVE